MEINIEEIIKNNLASINLECLVKDQIRCCITSDIKRKINEIMREQIDEIIKQEIDIVMKSSPVNTDDGWGEKKNYKNFEELFKSEFYKKLNSTWDIKREITKAVERHVEALFSTYKKELIQHIVSKTTSDLKE